MTETQAPYTATTGDDLPVFAEQLLQAPDDAARARLLLSVSVEVFLKCWVEAEAACKAKRFALGMAYVSEFAAALCHVRDNGRYRQDIANHLAVLEAQLRIFAQDNHPKEEPEPTFDCEKWPLCGCPDGTVDHACPALQRLFRH